MPGKEVYFYNAYSSYQHAENIDFGIDDANAIHLKDLNENGLVDSIVGKVKIIGKPSVQSFFRNGKHKTETMLECLISDQSREMKLTLWGELVDLVKDNDVVQFNCNAKIYHDNLVLTTTYSTGICQLTTDFNVEFSEPTDVASTECSSGDFVMCCPEIESIIVDSFMVCKKCTKKIKVIPGTGLIMCQQCNREYLIENVKNNERSYQMTFSLDLRNDRNAVSATVFSSTLSEFFSENVLDHFNNLTYLKRKILQLNKIDFTINSKRIVTKMLRHHDDE